eukprot:scaffold18348_cov62-Phaeocystis_antarctica.AAC.7
MAGIGYLAYRSKVKYSLHRSRFTDLPVEVGSCAVHHRTISILSNPSKHLHMCPSTRATHTTLKTPCGNRHSSPPCYLMGSEHSRNSALAVSSMVERSSRGLSEGVERLGAKTTE